MYIKKTYGPAFIKIGTPKLKAKLDVFFPQTSESRMWKHWCAKLDPKLCLQCLSLHGTIYLMDETPDDVPPLHNRCRCEILPMEEIKVGHATKDGTSGADYWLTHYDRLPDYYISYRDLYRLGWRPGKAPQKFAPGKMFFGGEYRNEDGHLPSRPGRIWYEADINYYEGKRNRHRILFSNDGLIFVTYNHYATFYAISQEGER